MGPGAFKVSGQRREEIPGEEVTRNHCHDSMRHLFDACKAFIDRNNPDSTSLVYRLWPKFELDPDYEKLLVSN